MSLDPVTPVSISRNTSFDNLSDTSSVNDDILGVAERALVRQAQAASLKERKITPKYRPVSDRFDALLEESTSSYYVDIGIYKRPTTWRRFLAFFGISNSKPEPLKPTPELAKIFQEHLELPKDTPEERLVRFCHRETAKLIAKIKPHRHASAADIEALLKHKFEESAFDTLKTIERFIEENLLKFDNPDEKAAFIADLEFLVSLCDETNGHYAMACNDKIEQHMTNKYEREYYPLISEEMGQTEAAKVGYHVYLSTQVLSGLETFMHDTYGVEFKDQKVVQNTENTQRAKEAYSQLEKALQDPFCLLHFTTTEAKLFTRAIADDAELDSLVIRYFVSKGILVTNGVVNVEDKIKAKKLIASLTYDPKIANKKWSPEKRFLTDLYVQMKTHSSKLSNPEESAYFQTLLSNFLTPAHRAPGTPSMIELFDMIFSHISEPGSIETERPNTEVDTFAEKEFDMVVYNYLSRLERAKSDKERLYQGACDTYLSLETALGRLEATYRNLQVTPMDPQLKVTEAAIVKAKKELEEAGIVRSQALQELQKATETHIDYFNSVRRMHTLKFKLTTHYSRNGDKLRPEPKKDLLAWKKQQEEYQHYLVTFQDLKKQLLSEAGVVQQTPSLIDSRITLIQQIRYTKVFIREHEARMIPALLEQERELADLQRRELQIPDLQLLLEMHVELSKQEEQLADIDRINIEDVEIKTEDILQLKQRIINLQLQLGLSGDRILGSTEIQRIIDVDYRREQGICRETIAKLAALKNPTQLKEHMEARNEWEAARSYYYRLKETEISRKDYQELLTKEQEEALRKLRDYTFQIGNLKLKIMNEESTLTGALTKGEHLESLTQSVAKSKDLLAKLEKEEQQVRRGYEVATENLKRFLLEPPKLSYPIRIDLLEFPENSLRAENFQAIFEQAAATHEPRVEAPPEHKVKLQKPQSADKKIAAAAARRREKVEAEDLRLRGVEYEAAMADNQDWVFQLPREELARAFAAKVKPQETHLTDEEIAELKRISRITPD